MKKLFLGIVASVAALAAFGKYGGTIELDKAAGFYKSGETARCRVLLTKDGKPLKGTRARCNIKWEGNVVEVKDFETTGEPVEFSCTGTQPGWAFFGIEVLGENGKVLSGPDVYKHPRKPTIVIEIGAMFDADKIVSCVREPADFDEFWAKRRAEVSASPLKPKLKELKSGVKGVKLFAVSIPVVRGITASGYLAYPANAKPKSLPAQIFFQSLVSADVSRATALGPAKNGALVFAATWHGFPVGQKKDYYTTVIPPYSKGGIRDLGDKEKWVYSDMFFRIFRELDFIKSLPEWDGKTLISYGGSLGGVESAFAAAMDKDVTLAVISVPSFCECNAYEAGRKPYGAYRKIGVEKLKADPKLAEAGFYFDNVNFAKRITCEVYVCTGFADEGCCPSNVFAFYNAIPATTRKTMTTNPRTGHYGTTKNVKGNDRIAEIFRNTTISELPKN